MKKRFSIYIEEDVWRMAQVAAYKKSADSKEGVSASQYVSGLIVLANTEMPKKAEKPNERSKDWRSTVSTKLAGRSDEDHKVIHEHLVNQTSDLTTEEIEAANERLKAKREQAKKQKPKKLIKTPAEAREWSGGFSKSRQLGKK